MTKRRILLDMDDVLARCVDYWLEQLNKTHNLSLCKADISNWNMSKNPEVRATGLTYDEIFAPMGKKGFFFELPVMEGAQEGVQDLIDNFGEVVIVTSLPSDIYRPGEVTQEKLDWLRKYFPYFSKTRNIVMTKRKGLVKGDLLIDDAPHNILEYPGKTVVFDQPYNQGVAATARVANQPGSPAWERVLETCLDIFAKETDERPYPV